MQIVHLIYQVSFLSIKVVYRPSCFSSWSISWLPGNQLPAFEGRLYCGTLTWKKDQNSNYIVCFLLLPHWKIKINVSGTIVSEKYPALGMNYVALRWILYFIELMWTSDTLISELKFKKKAPLIQAHAHTQIKFKKWKLNTFAYISRL